MSVTRVLRESGVVLVVGLLVGSAALAQSSSSVIIGTVVNADPGASKAPIADVVVTATSPNLQGEQTVVTDSQGQYRIPQLPPGVYTLRFDSQGYKPFARSDIQLRLNRTIRVNVELLPEAFTETIEIAGTPPTIDVGSTTTGVNVDQEFIRRIAVNRPGGKGGAARSFESLAELAPGAQNDQYGVSINGATSPENGYVVDGLSTNDPAFGINASPLSIEFVQDVNVVTGGYLPEFGRSTGGVINAVTRSGSNEFHGSVFGNWTPGTLEGERTRVIDEGSVISGTNTLKNLGDLGATLGGPILQDKLWFFAGFAPSFTRYTHTRAINAFQIDPETGDIVRNEQDKAQVTEVPGTERNYFADSRAFQYMGKLTYLINQDHNVSLSITGTPSSTGGAGKLAIDPRSGGLPGARVSRPGSFGLTETLASTTAVGLKYAGAFMDKKVLLDVNAGYFHQVASTQAADGSETGDILGDGLAGLSRVNYVVERPLSYFENIENYDQYCTVTLNDGDVVDACPVNNYALGGPGLLTDGNLDRYQVNAKATYLLNAFGTHVIKAGVDAEFLSYGQRKSYSGGVFFQEIGLRNLVDPITGQVFTGGVGWNDFRRYGYQTGPDTAVVQAVQESTSKSTTIGGFLQDSWSFANRLTVNAGLRYDVQAMYGGDGQLALVLGNQLSPRVGAIVDPLANGRMKFFVNFAKYYEQVPLNMLDRAFPPERRYSSVHVPSEDDPTGARGCDPSTLEGQRSGCANNSFLARRSEGSSNPNRLFTGGKVENEPVDPDLKPQSSNEYVVGGEYEVLANTRFGASYTHRSMGAVIEDMSRDDGNTYFLGNPNQGFASDFPKPVRNYDAVTMYLNRTFADGWLAQASYTWSRLYGNYPGLFRPETGQLDPNILSDFDLIDLLPNRTGLLPYDRTHSVKLFGAKEFNITNALSTSIGLSYRGNSGTPINFYGAHPAYGQDEAFVLARGSGGRTPWVNVIDSNVGVNYRIGKDQVVSFTLDVFNLFNFQTATRVDESYTFESIYPLENGTPGDLPGKVVKNSGDRQADFDPATQEFLSEDDLNKNFKQPNQYQSPRQFRLGIRYTF